jgi:heptosyltransferase-1
MNRILVVRLGAMGDVIHALPAAAALKQGLAPAHLAWAMEPRWTPLLAGNPYVDEVIEINRREWSSLRTSWARLRSADWDLAVDLQGLIKSALVARASGANRIAGYPASQVRERAAAGFYTESHSVKAMHIVDRHLELAQAVGANPSWMEFPLPAGVVEKRLPEEGFVLASPFAGWQAKEWPLDNYGQLGGLLRERTGLALVLAGHASAAEALMAVPNTVAHVSSISGLIGATRQARAVVGVDSGPLHLAAALSKPGVAIFGPTDPARNGPYGGSMRILRDPGAQTSYKRRRQVDISMSVITPEMVIDAMAHALAESRV